MQGLYKILKARFYYEEIEKDIGNCYCFVLFGFTDAAYYIRLILFTLSLFSGFACNRGGKCPFSDEIPSKNTRDHYSRKDAQYPV